MEYLIHEILQGINQECNRGAGYWVTKMTKIHLDNCRVCYAPEAWQEMHRMKIQKLIHPPYSPDLSPCGFWLFGWAKTAWRDQKFADVDGVVGAVTDLWDNVGFEEVQGVFHNWIERLKYVIEHNRECFIQRPIEALLLSSRSRDRRLSHYFSLWIQSNKDRRKRSPWPCYLGIHPVSSRFRSTGL
jgi:hypothetical protein